LMTMLHLPTTSFRAATPGLGGMLLALQKHAETRRGGRAERSEAPEHSPGLHYVQPRPPSLTEKNTRGRPAAPAVPSTTAECRFRCSSHRQASQPDSRGEYGRATPNLARELNLLASRGGSSGIHALHGRGRCCPDKAGAERTVACLPQAGGDAFAFR